jgi:hypothetical protein
MLAQVLSFKRGVGAVLLFSAAAMFVSCASQKERGAVVDDPDAKHESQIPWNKQEKWETGGSLQNMTDRR